MDIENKSFFLKPIWKSQQYHILFIHIIIIYLFNVLVVYNI